jgi:hypothetical protein
LNHKTLHGNKSDVLCMVQVSRLQVPDDLVLVLFYLTGDCFTWSSIQKELKTVVLSNSFKYNYRIFFPYKKKQISMLKYIYWTLF